MNNTRSYLNHWMSPLIITTNFEEKNMALSNPNFRVIIMDDDPAKYMELIQGEYKLPKNLSVLPVLLPTFESIDAYIEGDYEKSNLIYESYLTSPIVQECLNVIFTLLFNNIAVLIYVPEDLHPVINCINTFINYLYANYAVMVSNSSNPFPAIDLSRFNTEPDFINRYAVLIDLMYCHNTIPIMEFCVQFPIEYTNTISNLAMYKICMEEGGFEPNDSTYQDSMNFAIRYIYGMKQSITEKYNNGLQNLNSVAFVMQDPPRKELP